VRVVTPALALIALLALAGCSGAEPSGVASTRDPATPSPGAAVPPSPTPTAAPTASPTPRPTPSASPIPIYHPAPYKVAIEAGHGGPYWWGSAGRDAGGNQLIEKDLALDVALRLEALLREAGYETLLVRDGDHTLTYFDASDYRGSLVAETQARVDLANGARADIIVSIHFNGSSDASLRGTETYYNPDRPFGLESYNLAYFVQRELIAVLSDLGHDVNDRGVRNDAEVGGDPENAHSFLLGTNGGFRPLQMPGVISEALFLSNADDAARAAAEGTRQRLAEAYRAAIDAYFAWLPSQGVLVPTPTPKPLDCCGFSFW
jgi:N-acetylmuramoyl-L-alanine amidase